MTHDQPVSVTVTAKALKSSDDLKTFLKSHEVPKGPRGI